MSNQTRSTVAAIAGIVFIGLVGLGLTMFVLLRDKASSEPTEAQEPAPVVVEALEPISVSTSDRGVRWMFIDPERGLRVAQRPLDIPKNVRASVVVWKTDFPPHDVYYVVDLSSADLNNAEVSAVPLSPAEFEARSREVVTALWLAYDVTYMAEDLALEQAAEKLRGKTKKKRRKRQRRTVIDRINRYPTFQVPGR